MEKCIVFGLLISQNDRASHESVQLEVHAPNAPFGDVSPKYDPPDGQEGDYLFTVCGFLHGENLLVGDRPVFFPPGSLGERPLTDDPWAIDLNDCGTNLVKLIFALFAEAKTVHHESLDPREWDCLEDVLISL